VLLGNYSVLAKDPGRSIGGGAIGLGMNRGDFNKTSQARGVFTSETWEPKSGVPDGYRPPYTWIIPLTAGALAARSTLLGSGSLVASGAMGKNADAALTGSGSLTATGALIVQAIAALTGSGSITTANLLAVLNAVAALTGSGTLAGTMGADAFATAALSGSGVLALFPAAVGNMAADITPFATLSPQSLAQAVWDVLAADNDNPGTMGEKLNDASAAGDPWNTALPGAYAAGTAGYRLANLDQEVWEALLADFTTADTMGARMNAVLTLAKFLGLK
jgi:hypothetical protein